MRGRLLYNLATAHDRAYNIEGDLKHLRTARELYGRIVDEAQVQGYSEDLVQQAATHRDDVDQRLTEATKAPEPEPQPEPEPEPEPQPEPEAKSPGRALTITGGVVTGIGLASSAIWVVGMVNAGDATDTIEAANTLGREDERVDAFDVGAQANTLIVAGAVVSGVLTAAGIGLLVTGQVISRRDQDKVACAPAVGPRMTGLGCSIRF